MANLNPEALLLSAILNSKQIAPALEAGISKDHFTAHPDGWAFIAGFYDKFGSVPSPALVRNRCPHIELGDVDDIHYAAQNLVVHARTKRLASGLKKAHGSLTSGDYDGATNLIQQHLREASQATDKSATIDLGSDEITDELLQQVMDRHEKAQQGITPGIPTGWPSVDTYTGGVQKGHLWVLGARLGQGKTWHLIQMAVEAIKSGKKVLFISLEMPYREVAFRAHGLLARSFGYDVKSFSLSSGKGIDIMAYRQFLLDMPDLVPGSLMVNDTRRGRANPLTIGAQIERTDPDIVFLDYLTLLGTADGKRASDDWRVAASISSDVKDVAQRCDVPIVAAAQLNRTAAGGTSHPGVSSLSQSDAIGMDADAVMTLATYGCPQVRRTEMVKFRHGQDGWHFYSRFDPDGLGFGELKQVEAQDLIDQHSDDDEYDF